MGNMTERKCFVFRFSGIEVQERELRVLRDGKVLSMEPKLFKVLVCLLRKPGQLVSKDDLIRAVWGDTAVTDNSLSRAVAHLRRVLEDDTREPRYIETVSTVGYRFLPAVEVEEYPSATAGEASARTVLSSTFRRPKSWMLIAVLIVAVAGIGLSTRRYFRQARPPFQKIRFEVIQPTVAGDQRLAAITPDGKFVAYAAGKFSVCVLRNHPKESLWITQMAGGAVQIVPPDDVDYIGLTFSPDGNSLYFVRCRTDIPSTLGVLYKIPALGGHIQHLIDDVEGSVTLSPDGKQLAFVRTSAKNPAESKLIVANEKGGAEKVIASESVDSGILCPAWSPDGKTIAFSKWDQGTRTLQEVPVTGGPERPLSKHRWARISDLAWLSDGRGLMVAGVDEIGQPIQIQYVSRRTGDVSRITNDLNDYYGVSLTADSTLMAAIQTDYTSDIWVGTLSNPDKVLPISSGGRAMQPAWTPDGGVAYIAQEITHTNLWRMRSDGSNPSPLLGENLGDVMWPRISPDARYIAFSSSINGSWHIWRADIDGSNPRQLTRGAHEALTDTSFSPDGKWVVFENIENEVQGIWKIPINGGDPIVVAKGNVMDPVVSPDGKEIAYIYWDEKVVPSRGVAIIPFEGGPPTRLLDIPAEGGLDP
jgi:Tol biopolymer transport system component/DNA-binding winged helix-turn-helix (wHTH) protein